MAIKQNPLGFHKNAALAAEAVLAAQDQGKFKEMHEILLKNYKSLDRASIEKYARQIGLDMDKFTKALDTNAHEDRIKKEAGEAASLNARSTPASFVNGLKISGAQPYEVFSKVVQGELDKTK